MAVTNSRRIRTLELWLPAALLLGGALCLALGLRRVGPTAPLAPAENLAATGTSS